MTIVGATESSRDALNHLRSIKPNDGWSIEIQENKNDDDGLRLLRRNVPLTDHFFLDIHQGHNRVVGVLTKDGDTCQVLVDGNSGKPVSQKTVEYVSCANTYKGYKILTADEQRRASSSTSLAARSSNQEGRGSFRSSNSSRGNSRNSRSSGIHTIRTPADAAGPNNNNRERATPNPFSDLSEEDKQLYMKYAMMGIGGVVAFKILSNALGDGTGFLFLMVLPGVYVYGLQTCPENSTFDAKKEVKRVLRGHHLPENHPSKPRRGNFLEEWTAKMAASVATEVSALAGGYSTDIAPLVGGCAKHATVTLPTLGLTCEWIGFNDTWYHYRTHNTHESQPQQRRQRPGEAR